MLEEGEPNNIEWDDEKEGAFQKLKELVSKPPILNLPDFSRSFLLQTDASNLRISCILCQEYDGMLHPIAFASKKLLDRETRYSVIERECLAIVWGIEKFKFFLYGRPFNLLS